MSDTPNALSAETLSDLRELQGPEDPDFLKRLMTVFLEHSRSQFQLLEQAIRTGASADAGKIAHRLKSSCHGVGAEHCGDLGAQLEDAANVGNLTAALALCGRLGSALVDVERSILNLPEMKGPK